jgi:hypothetical protein
VLASDVRVVGRSLAEQFPLPSIHSSSPPGPAGNDMTAKAFMKKLRRASGEAEFNL